MHTNSIVAALLMAVSPLPALAQPAPAATSKASGVANATDVTDAALVRKLPGFKNGYAQVNGIRIHYVEGGSGKPLFLLPGWPQTWWEYHKVMPELAKRYRVISVDLRGQGSSDRPAGGYDKKTMAADVAGLAKQLGYSSVAVVGHDIGSMVAYAFAANYPQMTRRLVMLDVAHPDPALATWPMLPGVGTFGDKVGDGSTAYVWWFAFHQVKGLPEDLGENGNIAKEQAWFFHYLTRDDSSIDEFDRAVYASAYQSREAIRAGDAWYQAFPQDIIDYKTYPRLTMPILALGGPGYNWLKSTLATQAPTAKVVHLTDTGHFIPDEVPGELVSHLNGFLE